MPYKNADTRREKQKQYKKEKREEGRQTIYGASSLPQISEPVVEPKPEKKPWGWTINGVFIPLEVREGMPSAYI